MASNASPLATLVRTALGVALAAGMACAQAGQQCSPPDDRGVVRCSAGLSAEAVHRMAGVQEKSMWCWAASIAMIFRHHGLELAQGAIVRDSYGSEADLPAASGAVMTRALSRPWAAGGVRFRPLVRASDQLARRFPLTGEDVVAELAQGRPLLVGAMNHAVVLVGVEYRKGADGSVSITAGSVIDPRAGQGVRPLLTGELRPSYLAAVQVRREPADQVVAGNDADGLPLAR